MNRNPQLSEAPGRLIFLLLMGTMFGQCSSAGSASSAADHSAEARQEILTAEAAFADMAQREGVPAAFLAFAADSAVLNRNERIIRGPDAMRAYFDARTLRNVTLTWTPDFVDAAASGDLGYTYGKYQFSAVDSSGQEIKAEGIFHTVWKKQADGFWKFVYD